MTEPLPAPIAAFDIFPDRSAQAVAEDRPRPVPAEGARWRWLHFDRTDPGFAAWSRDNLPAAARSGLLQAETRPQVDRVGDGLLVNLRGMNFNPGQHVDDMVALRLWVADGLVVTTRQRRIFAFDSLRADVVAGNAAPTPGAFLARIADMLTARIETASAEREDQTDAIEEKLLDDRPDATGTGELEMSRLARSVIKLRRYIAPQRDAISRLMILECPMIDEEARDHLRQVASRTTRLVEELDNIRDRLASLRAHADSLNAARLAHNGFVLSVVAAIFLPLGFFTGLFGVNVAGMPGTAWPWSFAALTVGMGTLGAGLWLWFRWLKWF
ncbi:MAG: zinc transporter ZntB [Rhodobacteraceae bacterium]|nr:zinc transporter ZntB [Paracoccaceae bacterium]